MASVPFLFGFMAKETESLIRRVVDWAILTRARAGRSPEIEPRGLLPSVAELLSRIGHFFPAVAGWPLAPMPLDGLGIASPRSSTGTRLGIGARRRRRKT